MSRVLVIYFPMRPLPFLGGAEDVILDVCMSSPMYLVGMWVSIRVSEVWG